MDQLLTLLLILSPIAPPAPRHAPEGCWRPLKQLALELEVVGPHERWLDDYRSELGYVRRHWRELRDAPPLADSARFPAHFVAADCRRSNHAYRNHLAARRDVFLWCYWDCRQAIVEVDRLDETWKLLETATSSTESWVCRRRALAALRDELGPEDYYAGILPPALPLWRLAAK